jgi:hypothetical protein
MDLIFRITDAASILASHIGIRYLHIVLLPIYIHVCKV